MSPSKFPEFLFNKIGSSSSLYFCDSDLSTDPAYLGNCNCQKAKQIAKLRATFRDWDRSLPSIAELHEVLKIDENPIRNSLNSLVINKIGPPPLSIASPSRIWDWLMSEYYCPGQDLPCVPNKFGKPYCLNSSVVDDLVRLVDKNHMKMISDLQYVKVRLQFMLFTDNCLYSSSLYIVTSYLFSGNQSSYVPFPKLCQ